MGKMEEKTQRRSKKGEIRDKKGKEKIALKKNSSHGLDANLLWDAKSSKIRNKQQALIMFYQLKYET